MNAATPQVQHVRVQAAQAGQRIDNFLHSRLKGVPRSRIYRLLRTGEVRVNKGRTRQSYRLRAGDVVRIPPVRQGPPAQSRPPGPGPLEQLSRAILYEDEALLVLDKPSGMAVHGGSGLSYGVIEALRALRPQAPFLELVHRLDRETSGCLMVAKKRSALRRLHELLRGEGVGKTYLTLVKGAWGGGERSVEAALVRNVLRSGERVVRAAQEGKQARTVFSPVSRCALATLLRARPRTGRTHQIRVHALHAGHPIAGDPKYGDPDFNARMRDLGLRRLFLHAAALELEHPDGGERLRVQAPLDAELSAVLAALGLEIPRHV